MRALPFAVCAAVGLVCAGGVQAQDYKAEITRFVVDPCYTALIREHGMAAASGLSEKEVLETVKALAQSEIDKVMLDIFRTVKDRSVRSRMDTYRLAKETCIKGLER